MLKNLWMTLPVSLLCLTAFADATPAAPAPANSPTSATSTTTPVKDESSAVKFSLGLGASYATQAQTQPDGSRSEELDYIINPAMTFGEYKASVFNLYIQDLKDTSKGGSFIDPIWTFSKKSMPYLRSLLAYHLFSYY